MLDLNTIKYLKSYIKKNDIHLVHCHGYKEDFYAWLTRSTPLLATNHLWKRTTTALKIYAYIDSKILKTFNKIIAVSAPIQQEIIAAGINPRKVSLIANGINIDKFTQTHDPIPLKETLGIPSQHSVIGMISSLTAEKGHAAALPAIAKTIAQHPNTHLLIIGDGSERESLQQLTHTLGIDNNVTFTGSRNDIPALLAVIDIFLLYSSMEGLPIALLEAMAAAKAIIATDVGDVSKAVVDGITGILLEKQENKRLFDSLNHLISNPEKQQQLGQAAQQYATAQLSSDAMAKCYAEIYRALCK